MAEKKAHGLLGPIELAKSAYEIFKLRFWTMAGISLISFGIAILGIIVFAILGVAGFFLTGAKFEGPTIGTLGLLGVLAIVLIIAFSNLVQGAYLIALRDWKDTSAKKALNEAKKYVVPLFLTGLIQGLLIFGGYFLLFVPAFIFAIWFSFVTYIVIVEGRSGLSALHTSREYVRGRFWGILGRMIVIYLPEWIIMIILSSFAKNSQGEGLYGIFQFAKIILAPFYMMYMYRLYENVRDTAGKVTLPVPSKNKIVYFASPVLGYIVLVAAIIGLISIAPKLMEIGSQYAMQSGILPNKTGHIKPSTTIMYGIVQYYGSKGSFPIELNDLITANILPSIPKEESTGLPYQYTMLENGKDFKLCTPLGVTPAKCVTPKSESFDL
jgi:hypothetical protein